MQCCPRGSRQLCIRKMFHSMLTAYAILVLCHVIPEAPSNISQEKIQAIQGMSFEQHLVTLFTYVYIRSFTSKKIYIKLSGTRHSTQQPVKLLVGQYLKSKPFSQTCNAAETHAVLTHGFCKVSGPRLHKQLTLNGTL